MIQIHSFNLQANKILILKTFQREINVRFERIEFKDVRDE